MPRKVKSSSNRVRLRRVRSTPSLRNRSKVDKILDNIAKSLPNKLKGKSKTQSKTKSKAQSKTKSKAQSKTKSKAQSKTKSKESISIDRKIKQLDTKIAKLRLKQSQDHKIVALERQLSKQKHEKNIEEHTISLDSIKYTLDELKPTAKKHNLSTEFMDQLSMIIPRHLQLDVVFRSDKRKVSGKLLNKVSFKTEKVAKGADGAVYRCSYKDNITAIKVIKRDWNEYSKIVDPQKMIDGWKGLMKEIYLLSTFAKLGKDTPFLRFYDYLIVNNNLLIMMEFYPGKELFGVYRKLNPKDKLQTFKTLIDAVYQMHSSDIVHTDLHFGNILYKSPTDIKIIDMGRSICYNDEVKHKFCNKDNKTEIYPWARGFSNHPQIAPWRKRQCDGKGCSKEELMAGDLWSVCYPFASNEFRKGLESLYVSPHQWSGREFLDLLPDTYDEICESLDSSHVIAGLPDKMTDLYNISA